MQRTRGCRVSQFTLFRQNCSSVASPEIHFEAIARILTLTLPPNNKLAQSAAMASFVFLLYLKSFEVESS